MNERVMKKWTKALRSGKYKQGRNRLCGIDSKGNKSYCCLGVLCDLYNNEMKRNKKKTLELETIPGSEAETTMLNPNCKHPDFVIKYNGQEGTLPDPVLKWAGFGPYNTEGEFTDRATDTDHFIDDLPSPLVDLNDGRVDGSLKPKSFTKIADIIEEYHEYL